MAIGDRSAEVSVIRGQAAQLRRSAAALDDIATILEVLQVQEQRQHEADAADVRAQEAPLRLLDEVLRQEKAG